jgi:hypothetical protein
MYFSNYLLECYNLTTFWGFHYCILATMKNVDTRKNDFQNLIFSFLSNQRCMFFVCLFEKTIWVIIGRCWRCWHHKNKMSCSWLRHGFLSSTLFTLITTKHFTFTLSIGRFLIDGLWISYGFKMSIHN